LISDWAFSETVNELTEINARFIDRIVQDKENSSVFLVTEFMAGRREKQMTEYRVDFSNPNQPKITKLSTWREDISI
jgi:hypothetical protein